MTLNHIKGSLVSLFDLLIPVLGPHYDNVISGELSNFQAFNIIFGPARDERE